MPQQQTSSPGQGQRFDWWAAQAAATASESAAAPRRTAVPAQPGPARTADAQSAAAEPVAAPPAPPVPPAPPAVPPFAPSVAPAVPPVPTVAPAAVAPAAVAQEPTAQAGTPDSTQVYRSVQASPAFQDIRRSYRTFVFPACGAFLGWYLLYVAAEAVAPGAMRSPVAGPLNVAWLLGLLQFASTFLLTWLYARNARTKRDRAALGLRWDTQDQLR